jgi:photosystem II stability/assembly factor-like uncharacterized protein
MNMRGFTILLACFFLILPASAQWQQQFSGTDVQLRGISAVSDRVAWASGAKGTVLRTIDGGEHWIKVDVPGAEALDFRDIQAFDWDTAYVLSIGPGEQSRIYKTTDGGKIWQRQFTNSDPKAFYDCFAFWDNKHGIAVSDSVDDKFPLISTSDGVTWVPVAVKSMPAALPNEGAFAASGTCITTYGKNDVWFGTGGPAARVFHSGDRGLNWTVAETPIVHGQASQGIFSIAFFDRHKGVVVGGDYKEPDKTEATAAVTEDGGKTWRLAKHQPSGYRSGVVVGSSISRFYAVGTNGMDSSGGELWQRAGQGNFNAISLAGLDVAWAVGAEGTIVRLHTVPKEMRLH